MSGLEARVFFEFTDAVPDLANEKTVDTLLTCATRMFNPEKNKTARAKKEIISQMSDNSSAEPRRNDLYFVLPPSSNGSFLGIKWRGQATEILVRGENPQQKVQKLLWSEIEVKVSPASTTTTSSDVPPPVQCWSKFHLRCLGGNLPAQNNESLRDLFIGFTTRSLLQFASSAFPPDSYVKSTIERAALRLLEEKRFALVSVDKNRKKTKFAHPDRDEIKKWTMEQTDMTLIDLTEDFFPVATTKNGSGNDQVVLNPLVRSWCIEPSGVSSQNGTENSIQCSTDFVTACKNNFKAKVASYPQFLAERFF